MSERERERERRVRTSLCMLGHVSELRAIGAGAVGGGRWRWRGARG